MPKDTSCVTERTFKVELRASNDPRNTSVTPISDQYDMPYRLPSLTPIGQRSMTTGLLYSVKDAGHPLLMRTPTLSPVLWRMVMPQKRVVPNYQQMEFSAPMFQDARIVPSWPVRNHRSRDVSTRLPGAILNDGNTTKSTLVCQNTKLHNTKSQHNTKLSHRTSQLKLAIHPQDRSEFDTKDGWRAHGPFSRGFIVTCSTPANWLRMKLGRSQTNIALIK